MKWPLRIAAGLVAFVTAVNVIWWLAPTLGDPAVWRPLFAALVVLVVASAWATTRRT